MPRGTVSKTSIDGHDISITLDPHSVEIFRPFLTEYFNSSRDTLSLSFSAKGIVKETGPGGVFIFSHKELPKINLTKFYPTRSMLQNNTLRMVEKWIYYADNHRYPKTNDDIFWIHETLLEEYAPKLTNPETGLEKPKRTSNLNSSEMAWIINGALTELASKDIPEKVLDAIDTDFSNLWAEMYTWRYSHKEDPFLDRYSTWDEYIKVHPVCEFTGRHGTVSDPLIRMHIISAGADGTLYEEPWNWIHSLQSIHQRQHTEGWRAVLNSFPFLEAKVQKAKEIGNHKGVPEWQLPTFDSNPKSSSQYPMF